MIARYILCFLWGAGLASLWWAFAVFGAGKSGPHDAPIIILCAAAASLATVVAVAKVLIAAALEGKP